MSERMLCTSCLCPLTSSETDLCERCDEIDSLRSQLAAAEELISQLQRDEYVNAAAVILDLERRLADAKQTIREHERTKELLMVEPALQNIAKAPCMSALLGGGSGEDRCWCPGCTARRALGLEEANVKKQEVCHCGHESGSHIGPATGCTKCNCDLFDSGLEVEP